MPRFRCLRRRRRGVAHLQAGHDGSGCGWLHGEPIVVGNQQLGGDSSHVHDRQALARNRGRRHAQAALRSSAPPPGAVIQDCGAEPESWYRGPIRPDQRGDTWAGGPNETVVNFRTLKRLLYRPQSLPKAARLLFRPLQGKWTGAGRTFCVPRRAARCGAAPRRSRPCRQGRCTAIAVRDRKRLRRRDSVLLLPRQD